MNWEVEESKRSNRNAIVWLSQAIPLHDAVLLHVIKLTMAAVSA
jgi:hypothetical protein